MCNKENTLFTSRCFCEQKPEQAEAVSLWIWTQFYWVAASWVCVFAEILTLAQASSTFTPHLENTSFLQTLQHLWGFVPLSDLIGVDVTSHHASKNLHLFNKFSFFTHSFLSSIFSCLFIPSHYFKSISKEIYLLTVNLVLNIVLPDEAFLS